MACMHLPNVVCDNCRNNQIIPPSETWVHPIYPMVTEKFTVTSTWQCPGCKTWYGPNSIGYCECEKEKK